MWNDFFRCVNTFLSRRADDTRIYRVVTVVDPQTIMAAFMQLGLCSVTLQIVHPDRTSSLPVGRPIIDGQCSGETQLSAGNRGVIHVPSVPAYCSPLSRVGDLDTALVVSALRANQPQCEVL